MAYLAEVNTSARGSYTDGYPAPLGQTKDGILVVQSIWDYWARLGYLFNAHENTIGTALTGSAAAAGAIVLTAPTIRFTVPSGTTVFPHSLNVNLVTAAGVEHEFAVVVSDTDSYTSGGTALAAPQNWRTDDPRSTAVTNAYHCSASAIIEAALTNPRKFFTRGKLYATSAVTDEATLNFEKRFDTLIPIVGPASFLIYLSSKATALTFEFDLSWAEIPSTSIV